MKGTSKLYTDFVLKKYVNHLQFDELLIAIKLLRRVEGTNGRFLSDI